MTILKLALSFSILLTLWVNSCQGRRLTRVLPGSGCGTTREITNHRVHSRPNSLPTTPCSWITEDVIEFKTKFKDHPSSSSISQEPVVEINGGWSVWSEWSACSADSSTQERTRTCTNPPPSATHLDCAGDPLEAIPCQQQSSAPSYYSTDQGYNGNSIGEQSTTDARRCHILCQNSNEGCVAWKWKTNGLCSHYTDPGQLMPEPGSTSGPGVTDCLQNGSRYVGDNLNISREIELAEECQEVCLGYNDCLFFTHDTRGRICNLKSGHTGVENVQFFVSGPKQC